MSGRCEQQSDATWGGVPVVGSYHRQDGEAHHQHDDRLFVHPDPFENVEKLADRGISGRDLAVVG